jgi:hypothetical protein
MTDEMVSSTKKCIRCGEMVNVDAKMCRFCKKDLRGFWERDINVIPWVIIIILLSAIFLGCFHIVPDAPTGLPIIPKAHFTYSLTIISIKDFLEIWNNRTLSDAIKGDPLLDNLERYLIERGWIITPEKDKKQQE